MELLRERADAVGDGWLQVEVAGEGWLRVGFTRREVLLARHAFDAWRKRSRRRWRRSRHAEQEGLAALRTSLEEHGVGERPEYLYETEPYRYFR